MDIIKGDVLTLENEKYIVIETLNHLNNNYIFTDKLKNNEVSKEYNIFKVNGDFVEIVNDELLNNELTERFKELINEDLNSFLERNLS